MMMRASMTMTMTMVLGTLYVVGFEVFDVPQTGRARGNSKRHSSSKHWSLKIRLWSWSARRLVTFMWSRIVAFKAKFMSAFHTPHHGYFYIYIAPTSDGTPFATSSFLYATESLESE